MRVILHDPDENRRSSLIAAFRKNGITAEHLPEAAILNGSSGLDENVAVLLPVVLAFDANDDANAAIQKFRKSGAKNPLLVLQSNVSAEGRASILDAGADDALSSPFNSTEITARLRALARRQFGVRTQEVQAGDLTVFLDGRHPDLAGQTIKISASEQTILRILALNAGKVVHREVLFDALYALSDYQPYAKALDVHICKLRRKIEKLSGKGASGIHTYTGQGYALETPARHEETLAL